MGGCGRFCWLIVASSQQRRVDAPSLPASMWACSQAALPGALLHFSQGAAVLIGKGREGGGGSPHGPNPHPAHAANEALRIVRGDRSGPATDQELILDPAV